MTERIYLDFNASTPIAPEVAKAMRPFLTGGFGNPSSQHWAGAPAKAAVEAAKIKTQQKNKKAIGVTAFNSKCASTALRNI